MHMGMVMVAARLGEIVTRCSLMLVIMVMRVCVVTEVLAMCDITFQRIA